MGKRWAMGGCPSLLKPVFSLRHASIQCQRLSLRWARGGGSNCVWYGVYLRHIFFWFVEHEWQKWCIHVSSVNWRLHDLISLVFRYSVPCIFNFVLDSHGVRRGKHSYWYPLSWAIFSTTYFTHKIMPLTKRYYVIRLIATVACLPFCNIC